MPVALDFGTCNTVMARWNHAANRADLIRLDGLGRRFRYRLDGEKTDREAPVMPSLVHYGAAGRRLLGEEVASEGLIDHPGTFRWVKLDVLNNLNHARWVGDRHVRPFEAATEIVRTALTFGLAAGGNLQDEELVVTLPVEAFNHYTDWLEAAVRSAFLGRVSFIDEATACILGYVDAIRPGDLYLVFDFGGGTLDVSVVKPNPKAEGSQKCQVLGRAGDEIGGSSVDRWMLQALKEAQGLNETDLKEIGTRLLTGIEDAKIALSSGQDSADVTQYNDITGRLISHTFTQAELVAILKRNDFLKRVGVVVKRAIEEAREKYGARERDLRGVFMVGGTSLLLGVRGYVENLLPDAPVRLGDPFGSVAAGACRFAGHEIEASTVHDYCLESWNRETLKFERVVVIPKNTSFPSLGVICGKYVSTAYDNATELNLIVYEKSQMIRPGGTVLKVGSDGRMREETTGEATQEEVVRALNQWAGDFIRPDPPCRREQEKRFVVAFGIDAEQRCLVWVKDLLPGNQSKAMMPDGRLVPLPLEAYPLVKLGRRK